MTHARAPFRQSPLRRPAFTLVELMISIALALLLVLGINAVFKMSSDTVGTGMQVSEITRQFRTARTVMDNDFSYFVGYQQQPSLIITSYNQPAFRDLKDELAAETGVGSPIPGNYNPADATFGLDKLHGEVLDVRDADGNSIFTSSSRPVGGSSYLPQILNNRNHRVDLLSFFVRNPGLFQRQSPNYGGAQMSAQTAEYAGSYTSQDAWVVYGHLLQPNNQVNATNMLNANTSGPPYDQGGTTSFLGLGVTQDPYTGKIYISANNSAAAGTNSQVNTNNFYAANWILGRTAILLGDPTQLNTYKKTDSNGTPINDPQSFLMDQYFGQYSSPTLNPTQQQQLRQALHPLSWGSKMNVLSPAATEVESQTSQQDVAGTTLIQMHDNALSAENPGLGVYLSRWYQPLVSMGRGNLDSNTQVPTPTMTSPIWPDGTAPVTTSGNRSPWHAARFHGQAWPDKLGAASSVGALTISTPPLMHEQLAVQTPVFLRGCSQFVVEYAGDYVKQNVSDNIPVNGPKSGAITGIGEDGQIDFDVITDASGAAGTVMKRIRWYGMTRSLDDGVSVENTESPMPVTPTNVAGAPPTNSEIVRPLYRYLQQYTATTASPSQGMNPVSDVKFLPFEKPIDTIGTGSGGGSAMYEGFPDKRPANVDGYTCAWGPTDMDLDLMERPITADKSLLRLWEILQKGGPNSAFPSRSLLPWMIRVTIRLDDPAGRLPDGQTMQFIFNVPRPHP